MAVVASFTTGLKASDFPLTFPISIQFTDTSTGSPTDWFYDFGDGGTSISQNPSHTYSSEGEFTIKLTSWTKASVTPIFPTNTVNESQIGSVENTAELAYNSYLSATPSDGGFVDIFYLLDKSGSSSFQVFSNKVTNTFDLTSYNPATSFLGLSANSVILSFPESNMRGENKFLNNGFSGIFANVSSLAGSIVDILFDDFFEYQQLFVIPTIGDLSGWYVNEDVTIKVHNNVDLDTFTKILTTNSGIDFIGFPLSGSTPLEVAFDDTSIINIVSWKWDFGDGNTSTIAKPTNTYITNS